MLVGTYWPPGMPKLPASSQSELLEVARQRGVQRHLHAQVLEHRHARRRRRCAGRPPARRPRPRRRSRSSGPRRPRRGAPRTSSTPVACSPSQRVVGQALLHHHRADGGEAPRVGAGPHGEVVVGELGGLGAARVDDDERTVGIAGDLLQRGAGVRQPVGLPRVLADEQPDLGVLEVAPHVRAEHLPVHPELAGLLLRERVRPERRAEGGPGGGGVRAAEVVPLPATPVVEDRRAAPGVAHVGEAGRHLGDRGVPVDLLEGAVGPAAHGRGEAVRTVLVVVEPQGLLARVAVRRRMGLVPADAREPAAVVTAEAHLDAAVALAEDAGRRMPGRLVHEVSSLEEPAGVKQPPLSGTWSPTCRETGQKRQGSRRSTFAGWPNPRPTTSSASR